MLTTLTEDSSVFHSTVCRVRNDRHESSLSSPKTNLLLRGRKRETGRDVSSIPAGLNSVLDFCLFPSLFLLLLAETE